MLQIIFIGRWRRVHARHSRLRLNSRINRRRKRRRDAKTIKEKWKPPRKMIYSDPDRAWALAIFRRFFVRCYSLFASASCALCCVKHKSARLTDQAKVDSVQEIALNTNFSYFSETRARIDHLALCTSMPRNAISVMFCVQLHCVCALHLPSAWHMTTFSGGALCAHCSKLCVH